MRMKRAIGTIAGGMILAAGVVTMANGVSATNIGNEGCTPGYWKNHPQSWEEYTPATLVESMLSGSHGNVAPNPPTYDFPAALDALEGLTMMQALNGGGGPGVTGAATILLRAATAAYLNAAHEGLGYPYRRFDEPGKIQDRVVAALNSLDRTQMLQLANELDQANNLGCPLGGGPATGNGRGNGGGGTDPQPN